MSNVGEIDINLALNSKQFKNEVKNVQVEANSAGNKISSSFGKIGKACAAAFSVAAVTSFVKSVTQSAASVQAANSQFEQTFGNLSDAASSATKKVADESGIVQTRLQGVGTSIYAFAKTTGMDSANALNMMQEALQVTADSAAYYDRSLEDTAESLKSFLKGNYANDAALGLSCTETTRNTAANKLYGKSFKDLSESQKQLTLLQMVKDANAASGALGQAARESDGLENVLGNLKETWNQFLAVIGKPVLKVAVVVIQNITTALGKMIEVAQTAVNELGKLFGWETEEAQSGVQATSQAIAESVENQEDLTKETKKTNEEIERGTASFDKLNVISESKTGGGSDDSGGSSSSGDSAAPVAALTQKAEKSADSISDKFKSVFKNFYEKSGFKNFVDNVQKGINKVDWGAIGENCKSIFNSLKPIAKTAFGQIQKVGKSAFGALGSAVGAFVTIRGKAFQTVSGGVAKWLNKDQKKIQGFITRIGNNFSTGFNNVSKIFDNLGTIVGGSIDRMRPQMEESISNLLSGLTDFAGGIGEVVSGAFSVATQSIVEWMENDGEEIGLFFDNLQVIASDVFDTIGQVFSDIGTTLSNWWNSEGGAEIFKNVCDAFNNIGTTLMNLWNDWIMPIWNFIAGLVQDAWNNCLAPVFEKIVSFFGKVADCIATVWNNYLSPIVNWIIDVFGPVFTNIFNAVGAVFNTVFSIIGGVIGGILDALGGLIDFITGVFSGDWEKAWTGIGNFFKGIWEGVWSVIKGFINLIIDGLNLLWSAIYTVISGIVNAISGVASFIGSIFGQDWSFDMPEDPPLIPKLAKGGIVTAPTLALIGDNAGANSGNPEVVAPLNKLQGMMNSNGNEYDTSLLVSILDYLKRLYEMFIAFRNNGGNVYEFTATVDGSVLFEEFVKEVNLYKRRHNGALPF